MTPDTNRIHKLRQDLIAAFNLSGAQEFAVQPQDVKRVVVILGSSRSGSSLLFHLLSQSGAFYAPQGEETPFYRAAGVGWVTYEDHSDELKPPFDDYAKNCAFDLLLKDCGREAAAPFDNTLYIYQCAARLLLQWPELDLGPDEAIRAVKAALSPDPEGTWLTLVQNLNLEPGFYDLGGPKSRNLQIETPRYVFEEPPYIIQAPRQPADAAGLAQYPLLLKTSTNVYRLSWLKELFPHSEFRFVLLARNPAASINGLIDGWLSTGFHSHNLDFVKPLKIKGYSDVMAFGDRWWKFDLPPGWSQFDDASLPEVCAFQWRSAYAAALAGTAGEKVLNVKFEDLLAPAGSARVLQDIFAFAGTKPARVVLPGDVRPVMASVPPQASRWRQREDEILPWLESKPLREVAGRLQYDLSSLEGLV